MIAASSLQAISALPSVQYPRTLASVQSQSARLLEEV